MYMLDTNTVSYIFRKNQLIINKLRTIPPSRICISSITEAELRYGITKRQNKELQNIVNMFIESVTVYDWDSAAAKTYGELRASMEQIGRVMGTMDQLIAAHALSKKLTMVTSDAAFGMVHGLSVEDWSKY
ncbi:type II toxin-antitoxin system VapC family toxin [Xenorhabdus griffiniae]|uniref:type II toxin-antitoxin system VapC family toxin n=1 Tax=Xenorhabdus griffiniae TaxID=351672 RepID=UPI002358657E|nr:type II toxin-antitoxin system VapC family toxin [Xenorhabdus griffiniae]MDC9606320.1 type II toxin-antitoxin system VapC family toxin [Xenorhabdus griffiniae]